MNNLITIFFRYIIICSLCVSCATAFDSRGRYHKVKGGDTLVTIARVYGHSVQDVAELNNIESIGMLEVGNKIYLPERSRTAGYKKLPYGQYLENDKKTARKKHKKIFSKKSKKEKEKPQDSKIRVHHGKFIWPTKGRLSSGFGYRNGRRHDGIDIAAKSGTSIKAADSGKVVFSGKMRGYGNIIIVRHKENLFTVYAHNKKNKVNKGARVKRGQTIALVGSTGRSTGPHLHFEIRQGQKARNPMFFLPKKH